MFNLDAIEDRIRRSAPDLVLSVAADILAFAGQADGLVTLRDPHLLRRYPGAVWLALTALDRRAGCYRQAVADLRAHAETKRAERIARAS